jgi:hypothetical protein
MNAGADRLVERVQRRLLAEGRSGEAIGPSSADRTALAARVRRLRSEGHRFAHVRLSRHVLASAGADECACIGGGLVATGG